MKTVSSFALAMALGAGALAAVQPALAQRAPGAGQQRTGETKKKQAEQQAPAEVTAGGRTYKISKEARKPIADLQNIAATADPAAFAAALATAEAAAKNPDDRYVIAQLRLGQAIKLNSDEQKIAALNAVIASGAATPEELPKLYNALGGLQFNAKRFPEAAAAFQKVIEINPNYEGAANNLAASLARQNNPTAAIEVFEQRIAAARAANQPVPQDLYKQALALAYQAKSPKSIALSREIAAAYPTPENWRTAIAIYRQLKKPAGDVNLDALRLQRALKGIDNRDDYLLLAYFLERGSFYAEARSVIEEGFASGKVQRGNSDATQILGAVTPKIAADRAALPGLEARARAGANGTLALRLAEGYFGHGDHAKAAEFYRVAVQKGGVDANLANSRLGIALALAGQRAEAETAFKAVTGPRQELASYWLLWLSQRA